MALHSSTTVPWLIEQRFEPQIHTSENLEDRYTKDSVFVIAVADQKGGVAKTTTVVSLGGAYVSQGKEVLLIRIHRKVSEQIQRNFAEAVFLTAIGTDTKLRESDVAGIPVTHHMNITRGTLQ